MLSILPGLYSYPGAPLPSFLLHSCLFLGFFLISPLQFSCCFQLQDSLLFHVYIPPGTGDFALGEVYRCQCECADQIFLSLGRELKTDSGWGEWDHKLCLSLLCPFLLWFPSYLFLIFLWGELKFWWGVCRIHQECWGLSVLHGPRGLGWMDLQGSLWEMMENPILYFQVTDSDSLWSLTKPHYLIMCSDLFHRALCLPTHTKEDIWEAEVWCYSEEVSMMAVVLIFVFNNNSSISGIDTTLM